MDRGHTHGQSGNNALIMTLPPWVLEHLEGLPDDFTGQVILNFNEGGFTHLRVADDLTKKKWLLRKRDLDKRRF